MMAQVNKMGFCESFKTSKSVFQLLGEFEEIRISAQVICYISNGWKQNLVLALLQQNS